MMAEPPMRDSYNSARYRTGQLEASTTTMTNGNNNGNNFTESKVVNANNNTNHTTSSFSSSSNNNNNNSLASTTTTTTTATTLTPSDALALRRDGAESVISKLRHQLDNCEADNKKHTSRLSQCEAVILELKSELRTAHRQTNNNNNGDNNEEQQQQVIGELQIQLDRAHAQILTADMVRKELEDTLEAEHYTWELRTQDLERESSTLSEQLKTKSRELKESQAQWAASQQEYQRQINLLSQEKAALQTNVSTLQQFQESDDNQLQAKLLRLENERTELQACLDEALKELEAVDVELQVCQSADYESLSQLYEYIQERQSQPNTVRKNRQDMSTTDLIDGIREYIESTQVTQLQSAQDNNTSDLRQSLQDAVALIKPLQEAVTKADREKARLLSQLERERAQVNAHVQEIRACKDQLNNTEDEMETLQSKIEALELELSKSKLETANRTLQQFSSPESSVVSNTTTSRLSSKRQSEATLKQMLRVAQLQFNDLAVHSQSLESKNEVLSSQLQSEQFSQMAPAEWSQKRLHMEQLQAQLQEQLKVKQESLAVLEQQLQEKNNLLLAKQTTERELNHSLKEALGLIQPLQMHLEESELEKQAIVEELEQYRQQQQQGGSDDNMLHTTVRQLEKENSLLQDALEDMSQSLNNASQQTAEEPSPQQRDSRKMRADMVELQSRYEVTHQRLEDAHMENHRLAEALEHSEQRSAALQSTVQQLRSALDGSSVSVTSSSGQQYPYSSSPSPSREQQQQQQRASHSVRPYNNNGRYSRTSSSR